MANSDPNQQRNEENRRFVADILRQTANQYGRPGQRIMNRGVSFLMNTVMGLGRTASSANVGQIPKVSSYDMQVDQLAKSFRLPGAEAAIKSSGAGAPRGMSIGEATTRAFIKTGEESGLTLEEIKKLLEESRSRREDTDASGNITLDRLTQDAHDLYTKMAELFTVPDLSGKFNQIGSEQTKSARRERARDEYNARPITASGVDAFQPTPFMNKILDAANEVFGGKAAQRNFQYTATDIHGKEVKGEREGNNSDDIFEWLKIKQLNPQSVSDIGESKKQSESPMSRFMSSFADYMGVAKLTKAEQNAAEENLTVAIDKLVASTDKNTDARNPNKKPGKIRTAMHSAGRWMKAKAIRGAINTAKVMAKAAKPFTKLGQKFIPQALRQAATRFGAQAVGRGAMSIGASAATGARLGLALGALAGPVGIAIVAIIAIVSAVKSVIKWLNNLAEQALKTTLSLVDYNGQLAFANARLEVGRTLRKLDMANAIAPGGEDRLKAQNRLEQAMQPLEIAMTNLGNWWGTLKTNISASLMETLNEILAAGHDFAAWVERIIPGGEDGAKHDEAARKLRNPAPANQNGAIVPGWWGVDPVDAADLARRERGPRPPGMAVR